MNRNRKPVKHFSIRIDEKGMKFSKDMKMSDVLNTLLNYVFWIAKSAKLPFDGIYQAFAGACAVYYPDDYFPPVEELKGELAKEDAEMAVAPTVNESYQEDIDTLKNIAKEHMEADNE